MPYHHWSQYPFWAMAVIALLLIAWLVAWRIVDSLIFLQLPGVFCHNRSCPLSCSWPGVQNHGHGFNLMTTGIFFALVVSCSA